MKFLPYFLFTVLSISSVLAQSFADDDFSYDQQFVYGVNLNTQAGFIGGFSFRYAKAINERMYHSFSLEIVDIKDPKEARRASLLTGQYFVPGKRNFLYTLRPQYGREWILFRKAEQRGVQVNAIAALGPTLGFVAPYIIDYQFDTNIVRTEQYDPQRHPSFEAVIGTGSFAERMSGMQYAFGGSLKTSAVIEFSAFKGSQVGFEAGFMLDAFNREIEIMALSENKQFYTSVFFTLFYGWSK